MIIEFEPNRILTSCPPQWKVYYKEDHEIIFHTMLMTYNTLKNFLQIYAYETNNIMELKNFGIDIKNIKQNKSLK